MLYLLGADGMTCKHTHAASHTSTHTQRKIKMERNCRVCRRIDCIYPRKWAHTTESSRPTLIFFFVPLPAVSGLIFSNEAGSEIWLYLSLPASQQIRTLLSPLLPIQIYSDCKNIFRNTELWIAVYNLFNCRSIESLSQLHNSNLVTNVAEPMWRAEAMWETAEWSAAYTAGGQSRRPGCLQCIVNS